MLIQAILLVGGFGSNKYLRESLAAQFDDEIEILQPAIGSVFKITHGVTTMLSAKTQLGSGFTWRCGISTAVDAASR